VDPLSGLDMTVIKLSATCGIHVGLYGLRPTAVLIHLAIMGVTNVGA